MSLESPDKIKLLSSSKMCKKYTPDLFFLDQRKYIHSSTIVEWFKSLHPHYESMNIQFKKKLESNPKISRVCRLGPNPDACYTLSLTENQEKFNYLITESHDSVTKKRKSGAVDINYTLDDENLILEACQCTHEEEYQRILNAIKWQVSRQTKKSPTLLPLSISLSENLMHGIPFTKKISIKNNIGNRIFAVQVLYYMNNSEKQEVKLIDFLIKNIA